MIIERKEKLKNALIICFLLLLLILLSGIGLRIIGDGEKETGELYFSKPSGFYEEGFDLEIFCREPWEIRYTLDSSEPKPDSAIYNGPIEIYDKSGEENLYAGNIFTSVDYFDYSDRKGYVLPEKPVDKCMVVRAAAFDKGEKKTATVTESFFIAYRDRSQYLGIPIISLVLDPDDLFGFENGIYVTGKLGEEDFRRKVEKSDKAQAFLIENPDTPVDGTVKRGNVYMHEAYVYNYSQGGREWERRGSFSFFDGWHKNLLTKDLGVRVRGHNSRNFPQKSLGLFQRELYSAKQFYFPLLKNKVKNSVALSGGGDDMYSLTRDPFLSLLFKKNALAFGVQEFSEPVYLFLNGEFWGTYLISEKEDRQYLRRHYGVDEDDTLIVKNGVLDSGQEERYLKYYGELVEYVLKNDLSRAEAYKGFCDLVDIESLIDYYAARFYVDDSSDWPKTNVAIWRTVRKSDRPYGDKRWRFLNFDNNIELQKDKVDYDSIGAVLSQGKEDYEDLKQEYSMALDRGDGIEALLGRNIFFERMLPYVLFLNDDFKSAFYKRFKEIEDTVYDPVSAIKLLNSVAEKNRLPVVSGYGRWFGDRCGFADFDSKIEEIREFLRNRRYFMDEYMRRACAGP